MQTPPDLPMPPGLYLEKRRVMAGYSLASLARDLMLVSDFGVKPRLNDFLRLKLRLVAAEQGSIHLNDDFVALIANFVALDVSIYSALRRIAEGGRGFPAPPVCRNCACSFFDPCDDDPHHPDPQTGAHFGPNERTCHWVSSDLCSRCARLSPSSPGSPPYPSGEPPFIRIIPTGAA